MHYNMLIDDGGGPLSLVEWLMYGVLMGGLVSSLVLRRLRIARRFGIRAMLAHRAYELADRCPSRGGARLISDHQARQASWIAYCKQHGLNPADDI